MADRTSAGLFAKIFTFLAANPTDEHKSIAKELWGYTGDYDFRPYQMYCDQALMSLDLCHKDDEGNDLYGPQ